ncbi:MAG: hypothetical protein ACP5FU_00260 [Nitrososphaeria archaeon]
MDAIEDEAQKYGIRVYEVIEYSASKIAPTTKQKWSEVREGL